MTQSIETKYFTVLYDKKDSNVVDPILAVMDSTYENVIQIFRLKADSDKFTLYICPDVPSFKRLTGKSDDEYEDWMVGNADYAARRLCILSPNAVHDRSFDDMLRVCKHEVVHIAFDQLGDPDEANIFISEGIAVALAEQIDIPSLDPDRCPSARLLSDPDGFYANNGYLYSGVYALYLLKKYGAETYKRLYTREASPEQYLYPGFERDAVQSLLINS